MLLIAAGCQQPADPDGSPPLASKLPLETHVRDRVHCKKNDCADWYRISVHRRGNLRVSIQPIAGGDSLQNASARLTDSNGNTLDQAGSQGGRGFSVRARVRVGSYLVGVVPQSRSGKSFSYEIVASLAAAQASPRRPEPPPPAPPPPPPVKIVKVPVLEVENTPGKQRSVLLGRGAGSGLVAGQRGRLLNGGTEIARIEVTSVFAEGCRARLVSELTAAINPSTVAEIQISGSPMIPRDDPPREDLAAPPSPPPSPPPETQRVPPREDESDLPWMED
jgi:hypothetical protein